MRILFVCTGNMCRSPLAERLTSSWAEQRLGAGAAAIHIRSAGTDARDGQPMDGRSAKALEELGGSPDGFRSALLRRGVAEDSDLVLTMSRRHRHNLLKHDPLALRRTFTLPEAVDLAEMADLQDVPLMPLGERAREMAFRLNAARSHRRASPSDDVPDPIGRPLDEHRRVADQIAGCLEPLMDALLAPDVQHARSNPELGRPMPPLPPLPHGLRLR